MAVSPAGFGVSPPYRYSLAWAREIVDRTLKTHARAREILSPVFQLNIPDLAPILAAGSPYWPQIRGLLQRTEAWDMKINGKWTKLLYSSLLHFYTRNWPTAIVEPLTESVNRLTIQEQGNSKGGTALRDSPSPLPEFRIQYLLWGGYERVDDEGNPLPCSQSDPRVNPEEK